MAQLADKLGKWLFSGSNSSERTTKLLLKLTALSSAAFLGVILFKKFTQKKENSTEIKQPAVQNEVKEDSEKVYSLDKTVKALRKIFKKHFTVYQALTIKARNMKSTLVERGQLEDGWQQAFVDILTKDEFFAERTVEITMGVLEELEMDIDKYMASLEHFQEDK